MRPAHPATRPLLLASLLLALVIGLSPAATATPAAPAEAVQTPDGRTAVPLAAATPDWYTPELHQRVLAAGAEGVPLPDGAEVPASALAFTGIRPGSWMISPSWCTMNYVFGSASTTTTNRRGRTSTSGGGLYIGTAGHCTEVGDEVVLIMAPGVLVNIGQTVKSVDGGVGNDFALVQIRPELHSQTNPSMAIWGGPTAVGTPRFGQGLLHVGHGLAIGTGGTPRAGLTTYTGGGDTNDETAAYGWDGAATPGDSGSAVRDATGPAVGNLTHLVVGTEYLPAYIAGTSIQRMLQIAGQPLVCASAVPNPLPASPGVPCG
jgi:hypothetical protein